MKPNKIHKNITIERINSDFLEHLSQSMFGTSNHSATVDALIHHVRKGSTDLFALMVASFEKKLKEREYKAEFDEALGLKNE